MMLIMLLQVVGGVSLSISEMPSFLTSRLFACRASKCDGCVRGVLLRNTQLRLQHAFEHQYDGSPLQLVPIHGAPSSAGCRAPYSHQQPRKTSGGGR
jgi:hypothetical protein